MGIDHRAVIVEADILDGAPIRAVSYLDPEHEWDSGFAIWTSAPNESGDTRLVHLHCLLGDHPELERALDQAREHGEWLNDT